MPAEDGREEIVAGEIDELRPPRRRLTLAPLALDEVLVEDVNEDETSDSEESCGQAGTRWWEESSTISADPGTKNLAVDETDLGATNIIVESNITADLPAPCDKNGARVFLNRRSGRIGIPMRPWRGPLPRPRPAAISVLGDFLPIQLQSNLERPKEDWTGKGNRPLILGHDELVLRAKSFGRPTLKLEVHRSDRVNQRRRRTSSLVSSSNLKPPPQHTSPPTQVHGNLTYAAMAARPPPAGARGPPPRGPPPPRGAAGGGPTGGQPPPPRGPAGGGPAGGQQRRENAAGGQNYGGGSRVVRNNEQRYDGVDRRREWRPANRPFHRPIHTARPNANQPANEQGYVEQASGTRRGESSQQQIPTDHDEATKKAKKPRIPHCFRCKCNGHTAEECTANLDCVVCNKKDSHLSRKCPIAKMPKPNATLFGLGKSEFSFLQMPEFDYKLEEPIPAPTALVTITGGQLTAKVLESELAKLMRLDWKWEALAHGENSFLVPFPSEEELKRMNDVEFRLKHLGVIVTFSEWKEGQDAVSSYELEAVWLHITGIPHAWRHYLSFWAIGTVVGSTLQVDMYTFRRKGVVRVQVGVLNKDKFPYTTDLVFGKLGYDITFSPEPADFVPAAAPMEEHISLSGKGHGADNNPKDGTDNSNLKKQKTEERKQSEHNTNSDGPVPMQIALTPFPPNVDAVKILQAMKSKAGSTGNVMAERKHFQFMYKRRSATPAQQAQDKQANDTPCAKKKAETAELIKSGIQQLHPQKRAAPNDLGGASVMRQETDKLVQLDSLCSSNISQHGSFSLKDQISAGTETGRMDPSTTTESRDRLTRSGATTEISKPATENTSVDSGKGNDKQSDEDTLQKSMKRTAWKNLDGVIEQEKAATRSPLTTNSATLGYPLAPYLGCATEAYLPGVGFGYMSTFGASGQGVFYPGTWVAI